MGMLERFGWSIVVAVYEFSNLYDAFGALLIERV